MVNLKTLEQVSSEELAICKRDAFVKAKFKTTACLKQSILFVYRYSLPGEACDWLLKLDVSLFKAGV